MSEWDCKRRKRRWRGETEIARCQRYPFRAGGMKEVRANENDTAHPIFRCQGGLGWGDKSPGVTVSKR